jgi:hypothetical protein
MPIDKPTRRLPLRDLIFNAEKRTRDLLDRFGTSWLSRISDLRDLSRPSRKRSAYPTMIALKHAIEHMTEVHAETAEMIENLMHELEEIRDHARRERMNRR